MAVEKSGLYSCPVCGLHYDDKRTADACYAWCSKHSSCNLEVARQSVEARKAGRKG